MKTDTRAIRKLPLDVFKVLNPSVCSSDLVGSFDPPIRCDYLTENIRTAYLHAYLHDPYTLKQVTCSDHPPSMCDVYATR